MNDQVGLRRWHSGQVLSSPGKARNRRRAYVRFVDFLGGCVAGNLRKGLGWPKSIGTHAQVNRSLLRSINGRAVNETNEVITMAKVWLCLILLAFWALPSQVQAYGLRTSFGEVKISGLSVGGSYSLKDLINKPFEVTNTSDEPLAVVFGIDKPLKEDLALGSEPIPDTHWLTLEKTRISVGPSQVARTNLTISIPNDAALMGHKYMVIVVSRSEGQGGVQVGLRSKLLLDISSLPRTGEELRKKLSQPKYKDITFDVSPYETLLEHFPLGKKVDLTKEKNVKFKIVNPNDEQLTFFSHPVAATESGFPIPAETQVGPRDSVFEVSNKGVFKIPGNSLALVPLFLTIPNKPEYRGKAFFYTVRTEVLEQEVPMIIYLRLVVKTEN